VQLDTYLVFVLFLTVSTVEECDARDDAQRTSGRVQKIKKGNENSSPFILPKP
jgi:hypothetical protein